MKSHLPPLRRGMAAPLPAAARIAIFSGPGGCIQEGALTWLGAQGAALRIMALSLLSADWFDRHAMAFHAALVDADFLGDDGAMIDFCLRLRRFAPDLPVIVVSSRVARSDFTAERKAICDVTLRSPVTAAALLRGLGAALENHGTWQDGRLIPQSG